MENKTIKNISTETISNRKMDKEVPVKQIMTKNVVSVQLGESLSRVIHLIKQHKIRHLPVISKDKIVGIISSTDVNRLTFSNLFENEEGVDEAILEMLSISQVMTHKPIVVNANTPIKEVAEIFASRALHSLPVVENGSLVGIVTTTDVIKYMLAQY